MASETLEIVIKGDDQTSKPFGKIGKALGDIFKTAMGFLSAQVFQKLAAGAVNFAKSLITEASEAQEVTSQLNAVLASTKGIAGVTAEAATGLADSLSRVTRFEDDAILGAENLLLTFTNIGSEVFPTATETVLNMSQALGQDLKSSATQLGKALNDPVNGITALSRVGVNFTESQKAMIESMVAAGDVAGAQKLILQELQKEFGGSAEAAGQTFAGQLDILKNSLGNVKESIGGAIIPILQTLAGVAINALGSPQFQAAIDWFVGGITNIGEKVKAFAENGLPTLVMGLTDLANMFVVLTQGDFPSFVELLWNGLYEVGEALGLTDEQMRPFLDKLAEGAFAAQTAWEEHLKPALSVVWTFIQDNVLPIFGKVWEWLQNAIPAAIAKAKTWFEETLKPALQAVWRYIDENVLPIFADVQKWLRDNIPAAIEAVRGWIDDTLVPALTRIWAYISEHVIPIFTTVRSWLQTNIPKAIEAVKQFIDTQLVPAFRDIMKVLRDETNPELDTLVGKMALAGREMAKLQKNEIQQMIAKSQELWGALHDLSEIVNDIIDYVFDLRTTVGETEGAGLLGVFGKWLDILRDLFDPFDDINRLLQSAIDFVNLLKGAAESLYNWLKDHEFKFRIDLPKLPDWAIPGSPTPFEMGLRGIASAMDDLNKVSMPRMQQAFSEPVAATAPVTNNTYNYTLTANSRYEDPRTITQHLDRLRLLTQGGGA